MRNPGTQKASSSYEEAPAHAGASSDLACYEASVLASDCCLYALGNGMPRHPLLRRTPSNSRRSLAAQLLSADSCLSCCKAGNWHAVGAATDVVESHFVTESDRRGFSSVLTTDAKFDVRSRLASQFTGHGHKLAYAGLIKDCKRVLVIDAHLDIVLEELASIVA